MTLEEKQRKIKLISLIIIVQTEYAKRKPFKNHFETIAFAYEMVFWARELHRVSKTIPFKKGGIAIVGENIGSEIILR